MWYAKLLFETLQVAPLATEAALKAGAPTFLQPDDVVTHIDGRAIGDDFTVRLRDDELLQVCTGFALLSIVSAAHDGGGD